MHALLRDPHGGASVPFPDHHGPMPNPLLPPRADNAYRGHRLALVLLAALLLMKLAIALGSIFNGRTAATSADGIPIDSYTPAGATTVLSLFGMLGVANVVIALVGAVVLARYRTLVPLVFGLLLVQQASRYLVLQMHPIARTGTPPGTTINVVLLAAIAVGLALALWPRRVPRPSPDRLP